MKFCSQCGKKIEDYDMICPECGSEVETNQNNTYQNYVYNGYEYNNYANNNSYNNTYADNNSYNNTYADNNSYNNYQNFNSQNNGFQKKPTKSSMKDFFLGSLVAIVIAVILAFIFQTNTKSLNFDKEAKLAAGYIYEEDEMKYRDIFYLDYISLYIDEDSIYNSNYTEEELIEVFNGMAEESKEELENLYGEDYKITAEIKQVKKCDNDEKTELLDYIEKLLSEDYGINNTSKYVSSSSLKEVYLIKFKANIKGSKYSTSNVYYMYLTKSSNNNDYKIVELFDENNF